MSAAIVLLCNGTKGSGRCTEKEVLDTDSVETAREMASNLGWTSAVSGKDYGPHCAAAKGRRRRA